MWLARKAIVSPLWLAVLLILSASAQAEVRVERPISAQLPNIARFGQPYSWSFASDTFVDQNATAPLEYSATGLPPWAVFEPARLSISGTPPASAVSSRRANDTVTLTATNPKTGSTASTLFHLITMSGSGPTVNKPLAQQLPNVTTLGAKSILPSGAQLLPLGWSFSLGFAGDTFTSDSHRVYLSAVLAADGSPLPNWMHFDQTVTLWGLAPTDVHTAGSFYTVVVTASDVPGYAGANSSLQMVVSGAQLIQAVPFPVINATAGQSFQTALPLDSIVDSSGNPVNTSSLRVAANTSSIGAWLSFDQASRTFSGTPPINLTSGTPLSLTVPVTLTNSSNRDASPVSASAHIIVYPSAFSSALPDVKVVPGRMFQLELGQYVRTSQASPQITLDPPSASDWIHFDPATMLLSGTPPQREAQNVQVHLSLESTEPSGYRSVASQSFAITPQPASASPTPLPAPSRAASTSTAASSSFATSTNGFAPSDASSVDGSGGLSGKAKFAIAASVGSVGGLMMLILLMVCCRRYCAAEDRHFRGAHPDDCASDFEKSYNGYTVDDDRTLADERSPRFGWASLGPGGKKGKGKKGDEEASPYLDPYAALAAARAEGQDRSPFSDAMTLAASDEGQERRMSSGNPDQAVTTTATVAPGTAAFVPAPAFTITNPSPLAAEKPRRSSVFNLFNRLPKASKSNRSINSFAAGGIPEAEMTDASLGNHLHDDQGGLARPVSIGLGLEGMMDRDLSQMTTSKSLAARSSWESNLFYDDSATRGVSTSAAPSTPERRRSEALRTESLSLESPLEVPVRRALISAPMRHRNAHISTSPAFNLNAGFESSPERDDDAPKDRSKDARLSSPIMTSSQGQHHRGGGGSVDLDDAVVGYARKVNVEPSGTVTAPRQVKIQQGQRNLSQHLESYLQRGASLDTNRSGSASQAVDEDDPFEDAEDDPTAVVTMRATAENTKEKFCS